MVFNLIFSPIDEWAPIDYYYSLKTDFPSIPVDLVEKHIPHDFVISNSSIMAMKTAQTIQNFFN